MSGGIDLLCLFLWPVIEPENNVVVIVISWRCDRDGFVCICGEDRQRACRIESNASNVIRIDVLLVQDSLKGQTDAPPDVVGRLFLYNGLSAAEGSAANGLGQGLDCGRT